MSEIYGIPTAYVDGSFDPAIGRYAYGCVLFHPDGTVEELSGCGDDPEVALQRNVSGEMIASMLAVKWARVNGYSRLAIYYDYVGIEAWAVGTWKAKNKLTSSYRDTMRRWMENVNVEFHKVAAHTADRYNEQADRLAKSGLLKEPGLPDIVKLKQE